MDAIAIACEVLQGALGGVPVSTEVPRNRPDRHVTVTLEGDQSDGFLEVAAIGLTCWGRSDLDARGMALAATEALRDAALDHPLLSASQTETIARDEWAANGQARYYARVTLYVNI